MYYSAVRDLLCISQGYLPVYYFVLISDVDALSFLSNFLIKFVIL